MKKNNLNLKTMKLISMVDFVLEQSKKDDPTVKMFSRAEKTINLFRKTVDYANFLKQPLTLGMFVPCDEDGNVLEMPPPSAVAMSINGKNDYDLAMEQYRKAKKRVLFEDVEIIDGDKLLKGEEILIVVAKRFKVRYNYKYEFYGKKLRIENMVDYKISLTKSAQKQILL